jgi:peptidoglycan/LPS O-acetylase OafA/YrhL
MAQLASESRFGAADAPRTGRNAALDYLRSFGVLLVLLHHAVLAYVTFGFLNPADPMGTFSPIVDGAKWAGFDRIALVNDTFFMPLLFLVSGLFVWQSLKNRGVASFVLGRAKRLGIPFVIGLFVLTPLAFYPTMLEIKLVYGISQGFGEFWLNFVRGGLTQPGPLWFIWLLLAFDILVALSYGLINKLFSRSNRESNLLLDNPLIFVLALFGLSIAAYIPMSNAFGPSAWAGIGPFQMQISRVFVYLLYFLAGVALGSRGLERGALRSDGPIAKTWWAWVLAGAASYAGLTWIFTGAPTSPLVRYVFLAEMALMVMALTALFVRFARRSVRVLNSLSANSYGIYLIHYLVVIWLQYAVLRVGISAGAKFAIVFFGGLAICWGSIAALRRIPAVRRII